MSNSFNKFYYTESEMLDEKLSQAIATKFLNIFRKLKKVALSKGIFNQLQVFPIRDTLYSKTIEKYSDWYRTKKKLGKKGNIFIKDLRAGIIDEKVVDMLNAKFKSFQIPNDLSLLNKDDENGGHIPVYLLNNGGKLVLFDLPTDKGARAYALGLDGKAIKVFQDMMGLPIKDYIRGMEGAGEQPVQQTQKQPLKIKEIDKNLYLNLVPFQGESVEESEELDEKKGDPRTLEKRDGKWYNVNTSPSTKGLYIKKFLPTDKAKNPEDQAELDALIKKSSGVIEEPKAQEQPKAEPTATQQPKTEPKVEPTATAKEEPKVDQKISALRKTITANVADGQPVKVEPSKNTETGWSYTLKTGGQFMAYKTRDGKYKLAFDNNGEKFLQKLGVVGTQGIE